MLEYKHRAKRKKPIMENQDKLLSDNLPFDCSLDCLDAASELERRREMVQSGSSQLLDGSKHLKALLEARKRERYAI